MFDEVALMPKSFVEQALARCSVKGSRFWFNCNPDSPQHWFYREWIQKLDKKNAAYLHFTMDDNYSLDPAVKKRYENLYTGVFYERYILGLWVLAEGLIYSDWNDKFVIDDFTPPDWFQWYISMDYGTVNQKAVWAEKKANQGLTNAAGFPIIEVKKNNIIGEPNTITQRTGKNGGIERNYIGSDGKQYKQVANNDHGNPKQHPFGNHGEHAHDYIYDDKGNLIDRPVRELNDTERKENADIL